MKQKGGIMEDFWAEIHLRAEVGDGGRGDLFFPP